MKRSLENKIAWITGAGSGIGQNAAITLSKLGMKVILSGRNLKNLEETSLKCKNDTSIKLLDVSDKQSVNNIASEIIKEFIHIDILINCAGINIENRDWDNIHENDWDNVFQTNINGLFYCCKAAIPMMKEKKRWVDN
jgi:3-oxoacyl-[acyl-carrier protein] reductase